MNFCFSAFWKTCIVLYKSLLDPFVQEFKSFWKNRAQCGITGFLRKMFKACSSMFFGVICSPIPLLVTYAVTLYSCITNLKIVGNYIASDKTSIGAVSMFKLHKDEKSSAQNPQQKMDNGNHLDSGFSAILGYMFGLYIFRCLPEVPININNGSPAGAEHIGSRVEAEQNKPRVQDVREKEM